MINKCSEEDFEQHEWEAFRIFSQRSQYAWIQDFGEYDPDGSLKKDAITEDIGIS